MKNIIKIIRKLYDNYTENRLLIVVILHIDFLIPYRWHRTVYVFRNISDIESWENRRRDIWYRMFGKRAARKICESGTRCYPLNFYPQRVIHRCIPNSKNNIESPTTLSMQCNSNRYRSKTKKSMCIRELILCNWSGTNSNVFKDWFSPFLGLDRSLDSLRVDIINLELCK